MADNILIPIVLVTQHPGVPITPAVVIPTKVGVNNHMVAQAGSKLSNSEEEHLLRASLVIGVNSDDGNLYSHHDISRLERYSTNILLAHLTKVRR
jgi:hypothetical protein